MPRNAEIGNELLEISPAVANLDPSSPFKTPQGYFEGLTERIMTMIKAHEADTPGKELSLISPFLEGISREMPNSLPSGYFDGFGDDVFSKLKGDENESSRAEIDSLSPLLAGLRSKPIFEVPETYFQNLTWDINLAMDNGKGGKIVPLGGGGNIFLYASAAIVIGFISISAWVFFSQKSKNQDINSMARANTQQLFDDSTIRSFLPQVSDDAISDYLENEVDALVPVVTEEDLNNATALLNIDESDFKTLLHDIPDDEIQQYLKENPGSKDEFSTN